ncbi:hypothetical protein BGZ70_005784 [Mortierella alpina]|uniref:Uncharacterized protein n=1 Tax=Mortierella alpina TaxID=64518 RepID=A0A9P6LUA6_MORAP|nr:hypothetical protein BGZ70_005784 [Mortierella alpina]
MSRSLWGLKLRLLCDELAGYLASDNRNNTRIAAFEEIQAKKGPDAVVEEQPQHKSGIDLGLSDDLVLAAEDID